MATGILKDPEPVHYTFHAYFNRCQYVYVGGELNGFSASQAVCV